MKDSAKTIVCYGDSNTWGAIPNSDFRYPRSVRWPSVLQKLLGMNFEVINEGLCGRTFVAREPGKPHRQGITNLRSILETNDPISLIVIMLGTNDAKSTFKLSPSKIAIHLQQTINLIRKNQHEFNLDYKILIVCPPSPLIPQQGNIDPRMMPAIKKFKTLPRWYKMIAQKNKCHFLNAGDFINSSTIDGYHFDWSSHLKLARILSTIIVKLLS